jgi:hypothetical protein
MGYKGVKILITIAALLVLSSFIMPNKQSVRRSNWINVKYKRCLENKLPCECEKITKTYFTISLDTNAKSESFGALFLKYDENEFDEYNIEKKPDNTYGAFRKIKDSIYSMGHLVLKNDSLYYFDEENVKSAFIHYGNSNDEYDYRKENISLLDNAFIKRGYHKLENILNQDSLSCDCNKELGKINLISIDKKSRAWIIEQDKDSLLLYDYVNSSEGKREPPAIIKKLFKGYKW